MPVVAKTKPGSGRRATLLMIRGYRRVSWIELVARRANIARGAEQRAWYFADEQFALSCQMSLVQQGQWLIESYRPVSVYVKPTDENPSHGFLCDSRRPVWLCSLELGKDKPLAERTIFRREDLVFLPPTPRKLHLARIEVEPQDRSGSGGIRKVARVREGTSRTLAGRLHR